MDKKNANTTFNFENTYKTLPPVFYSIVKPEVMQNPSVFVFNNVLKKELGINEVPHEDFSQILSGNKLPDNSDPLAQAYAGHQFGHFTMLGDGRAILLGEHISPEGKRFDIQLKGSGKTPYSRGGDGKATLKAMLREYLMSEAMHYLGIPTSRSLAVVKTDNPVYRETPKKGAVLTRVMSSHIRIGTFEYARYFGSNEDIQAITNYTINRHFPELSDTDNPALELLDKVMRLQIDLVVDWMRVGFIHGVMNTDNISICGETFDYGPCAFMNNYKPETVFSSIDSFGRYSYENQAKILKWNIAKLAEAILPLIHSDEDKAVSLATNKINQFDSIYSEKYYRMMFAKIGIKNPKAGDSNLLDELMSIMLTCNADYTNTFNILHIDNFHYENSRLNEALIPWKEKWKKRTARSIGGEKYATSIMKENNPVLIPRNIHIEEALELADKGDLSKFNTLLNLLQHPYEYKKEIKDFLYADSGFDETYQTFCGT
ncbi:MAG: protein adenylyltransferase SelO [Bacteroidota bacterium]